MFIIRLFLMVLLLFGVLTALFSAFAWIKIRSYLQNPFLKTQAKTYYHTEHEKVIEGEYEVIENEKPQDH